jgi:hypothetical protein
LARGGLVVTGLTVGSWADGSVVTGFGPVVGGGGVVEPSGTELDVADDGRGGRVEGLVLGEEEKGATRRWGLEDDGHAEW